MFINAQQLEDSVDCRYPLTLPKKPGETVYVHPADIEVFVKEDMGKIQVPFIVITNNTDFTIPHDAKGYSYKLHNNPLLHKWFAQNCLLETPKLKHIPIGIDFMNNKDWNAFEGKLKELRDQSLEKKPKIFGNFQFAPEARYGWDRRDALAQISRELIDYQEKRLPRDESLSLMASYKYVASPFGNGMECYRTWEAIIVGCIPIVLSSGLDPLYEGLPVLIVKSWKDITRELLDSFVPDRSCMKKVTMDYWCRVIAAAQEECSL